MRLAKLVYLIDNRFNFCPFHRDFDGKKGEKEGVAVKQGRQMARSGQMCNRSGQICKNEWSNLQNEWSNLQSEWTNMQKVWSNMQNLHLTAS